MPSSRKEANFTNGKKVKKKSVLPQIICAPCRNKNADVEVSHNLILKILGIACIVNGIFN